MLITVASVWNTGETGDIYSMNPHIFRYCWKNLFQIIKPTLFHNHLLSMLTMEELPGKGPHLHEFGSCLFCFFVESGSFLLFGHFLTSNVWRSSWNDSTLSPSPPLWDEMCKNAHKNKIIYFTVSIPIPDIRNPDSSEDQIYSNGDSIWKL